MLIVVILAVALLAIIFLRTQFMSFTAQRPENYSETSPAFEPARLLNGPIASEGVIFGPTGRAASRFIARMEGRWEGDTGTLTEYFTYDSGQEQRREWQLRVYPGGRLTATAADVIGTGEGRISGATLRLSYRIRLTEEAGGHVLDVVDWLYAMPDGSLINRSQMGRFGVRLAELVATLRPQGQAGAHAAEARGPSHG